jgi:hypothetical protein
VALGAYPALLAIYSTVGRQQSGASAALFIYGLPFSLIGFFLGGVYMFIAGPLNFYAEIIVSWLCVLLNSLFVFHLVKRRRDSAGEMPNQSTDSTLASGTPGAEHQSRHL